MISVKNLSLSYGARKLFNDISFAIENNDKIGLVGSNGAGKSTLLKIFNGAEDFYSGDILMPKNLTIGYLPQEVLSTSTTPLYNEIENSFEDIISLRKKIQDEEEILNTCDPKSDEYAFALHSIADMEEALVDFEESKIKSQIQTVLHGLGFDQKDMQKPCCQFSGGWQMRILLAKLLLKKPSLLMLDEPTNHLDISSVVWLENYLKNYKNAVIIISHDRAFLDGLTKKTFSISNSKLEVFAGNYSYFEKEKAARTLALEKAAILQEKQIKKTQEFIDRFRSKASKAAQAQSRLKALEKVEIISLEKKQKSIHFSFEKPTRCAELVVDIEKVSKYFDQKCVLKDVSLKIQRQDRIAVVGINGAGKSTLAKIMASVIDYEGKVTLGKDVELSYFAQHQAAELDKEKTALEEVQSVSGFNSRTKAQTLLGSFLFSGDDAHKKVRVLSGGEKNRLALAKMLLKSFNFLILDEPTNHLDMQSKEILQSALKAYEGTIFIVSHDRDFIDPLVNKVLEISKTEAKFYFGNVSEYIEKKLEEEAFCSNLNQNSSSQKNAKSINSASLENELKNNPSKKLNPKEKRSLLAKLNTLLADLRRKVSSFEKEISSLENENEEIENLLCSPEFYKDSSPDFCKEKVSRHDELKDLIEQAYSSWGNSSKEADELKEEIAKIKNS